MEIKKRVYDLLVERGYIANGHVTSDKVISDFIEIIEQVQKDIKICINEEKDKKLLEAIEILKTNNIKELELCKFKNFGYWKIELDRNVFNIDDELYNELCELLEFLLDEDFIFNVLCYNREGQNTLLLTHDGFKVVDFRV